MQRPNYYVAQGYGYIIHHDAITKESFIGFLDKYPFARDVITKYVGDLSTLTIGGILSKMESYNMRVATLVAFTLDNLIGVHQSFYSDYDDYGNWYVLYHNRLPSQTPRELLTMTDKDLESLFHEVLGTLYGKTNYKEQMRLQNCVRIY